MTPRSKEEAERNILERLLLTKGIVPETPPQKGETPDFMVQISSRTIGVEVTTYQSGKTIIAPDGRRERREVEAEWECLKCFSNSFRDEHPDLKNIGIIFWFKTLVPQEKEYRNFLLEVKNFISSKHNEIGDTLRVYWNYEFTSPSPLMEKYLKYIAVNIHENAEWDSDKASGGFIDPPAGIVARRVLAKSVKKGKTINYRNAAELWLVIDSSGRNSETNLPIKGV
jgi:hypothetical protein